MKYQEKIMKEKGTEININSLYEGKMKYSPKKMKEK